MKTNKSFLKRIKVTKNGKLVVRAKGQNHFNAKDSSKKGLHKGRASSILMTNKNRGRYLNNA